MTSAVVAVSSKAQLKARGCPLAETGVLSGSSTLVAPAASSCRRSCEHREHKVHEGVRPLHRGRHCRARCKPVLDPAPRPAASVASSALQSTVMSWR